MPGFEFLHAPQHVLNYSWQYHSVYLLHNKDNDEHKTQQNDASQSVYDKWQVVWFKDERFGAIYKT